MQEENYVNIGFDGFNMHFSRKQCLNLSNNCPHWRFACTQGNHPLIRQQIETNALDSTNFQPPVWHRSIEWIYYCFTSGFFFLLQNWIPPAPCRPTVKYCSYSFIGLACSAYLYYLLLHSTSLGCAARIRKAILCLLFGVEHCSSFILVKL